MAAHSANVEGAPLDTIPDDRLEASGFVPYTTISGCLVSFLLSLFSLLDAVLCHIKSWPVIFSRAGRGGGGNPWAGAGMAPAGVGRLRF